MNVFGTDVNEPQWTIVKHSLFRANQQLVIHLNNSDLGIFLLLDQSMNILHRDMPLHPVCNRESHHHGSP